MTSTTLARYLARLSLLVAALLQFSSAAAGPWVHLALVEPAAAVAPERDAGDRPDAPAPHDEQSCLFCHSSLVAAMLPDGPSVPVPPTVASADSSAFGVPVPVAPGFLPSARGPPLA